MSYRALFVPRAHGLHMFWTEAFDPIGMLRVGRWQPLQRLIESSFSGDSQRIMCAVVKITICS